MEREILLFENPEQFEFWLTKHHSTSEGIWLQIFKKDSAKNSITYAQALDCALCFGWIDGQKAKHDEQSWLQYFTRRKKKSIWSQVNKENVARLIREKRMQEPGMKAIEEAKKSGQWDAAYQPVSSKEIPPELEIALQQSPKAKEFFESLNSQNRFAFIFRIATAKKEETKAKKVKEFIQMMEKGAVFYPKKS